MIARPASLESGFPRKGAIGKQWLGAADASLAAALRPCVAGMAAPSAEELAELFKAFDPDGSGVLTVEGLLSVMRTQCVVPSGQRSLPAHPLPASPLQRCAD